MVIIIKAKDCTFYTDPNYYEYLIEYRGDFLGQIETIPYACGNIINNKFAIISVKNGFELQLLKDVPSILYFTARDMFVLQSTTVGTSGESTSNITSIKNNPYLDLSGSGVLVGIIDTGIDYLNKEFTKEDGTTRIETIWDQTAPFQNNEDNLFIGATYSSNEINMALEASRNGQDPYSIVPTKDTIGHGTHLAGIVGARGYNKEIRGIAHDCTFAIVKVMESATFKEILKERNIDMPIYNISELVAGLEYLKNYALKTQKHMVILVGMGSTTYSHDGLSLFSRYLNDLTSYREIVMVTGVGNEGLSDGHASGIIKNTGDIGTIELSISKEFKSFYQYIVIRKPNKMSLNIISPSSQQSKFIPAKLNQSETINFISENTKAQVQYYLPSDITGLQTITINFSNLKPGIWKFELKGEYIVNGRYDSWLPPASTMGNGAKFLNPDPYTTLTSPSCVKKAISVSYYNELDDSIVNESGKGFPLANFIKPNIAAPGINILTTAPDNKTAIVSGSSVAAAITAGACALLVQWGIVNKNDPSLFSAKILNYLITGASRRENEVYPNPDWGYGKLDFQGIFNTLSGNRLQTNTNNYFEYYVNNLFIRLPKEMRGDFFD